MRRKREHAMQPTLKQLAEAMNLTADELAVFLNENPSAVKAEMEREEAASDHP